MEIGTVETIDEPNEPESGSGGNGRMRRPGGRSSESSGGDNDGGGNGGGGSGGGGGGDRKSVPENQPPARAGKSRVMMWVLLIVVLMTFGGLIATYVVISSNRALEWRPFDLPFQVWISTVIILASSVTYTLGKNAFKAQQFSRARGLFVATACLGAVFISSQILAWMALVNRGLYVSDNQYLGFFYILTGIHAVHVFGGICGLGYILLRTWYPPVSDDDFYVKGTETTVTGWYWHTMDGLWLILLFLLGFWK